MKYGRILVGMIVVLMAGCTPGESEAVSTTAAPSETSIPISPEPSMTEAIPSATATLETTNTPKSTNSQMPTNTPSPMPRPSLGSGPFRAVAMVDGVIPGEIRGLLTTPDDRLWLYSDQAVALLQTDETWSVYLPEYDGSFAGIEALGRVWVIEDDLTGIAAWDGQDWTRYGEESGWVSPSSAGQYNSHVHMDTLGQLWLATITDVRVFDGQQWQIFGPEAMSLELDEYEGIGTLYRLRVNQDVVWAGECGFAAPVGGQGIRWFDGEWHGGDIPLETGCVTVITVGGDGQIWVGQSDRLWQTDPQGEVWTSLSRPDEVLGYPIDLDIGPSGEVWAAYILYGDSGYRNPRLAFYHIKDGVWTQIAATAMYSLPNPEAVVLDADGTPWLFSSEGIDRVHDNIREPVANLIPYFVTQNEAGEMWFIAEQDGQNWLWAMGRDDEV